MDTVTHSATFDNPTLLPLDLVDDFAFDALSHYEPTPEDLDALRSADREASADPGEPYPFADWLADQAGFYRSQETEAAHWLASTLDRLAGLARFTGAPTGEDLDARVATLESERAYRIEACRNEDGIPGWGILDADNRLVDWRIYLEAARAELASLRAMCAYTS